MSTEQTLKLPSSSMIGSMNSKLVSLEQRLSFHPFTIMGSTFLSPFIRHFMTLVKLYFSFFPTTCTQNFSMKLLAHKVINCFTFAAWKQLLVCRMWNEISIAFPLDIAVQINAGRVDINLKKKEPHTQWENIGTFLAGHSVSTSKSKRGM